MTTFISTKHLFVILKVFLTQLNLKCISILRATNLYAGKKSYFPKCFGVEICSESSWKTPKRKQVVDVFFSEENKSFLPATHNLRQRKYQREIFSSIKTLHFYSVLSESSAFIPWLSVFHHSMFSVSRKGCMGSGVGRRNTFSW